MKTGNMLIFKKTVFIKYTLKIEASVVIFVVIEIVGILGYNIVKKES